MSAQKDRNAGAGRDQARARLRTLTNAALLATTGATVGIAVVVAHEHPGKSAAASTSSSGRSTTANTGTTGGSGDDGSTGNTGTSSSGNTGNSGSSFSPGISSQTPSVTSGGSVRR